MNLGNVQPVGANLLARRWHCVIRNTASRTSSLLQNKIRPEEQYEYFKINPDLMPEVEK
jgi:hypothetical protein